MPTIKAAGYANAATAAQANQILHNRGTWNTTVQAAGDKVLIGKLPVGHRLLPALCAVVANALVPAGSFDVCVVADTNKLIAGVDLTASTASYEGIADGPGAHLLGEALGVDYQNDRDIYLLLNSGFATAPAGAQVVLNYASFAAPRPD